MKKCKYCKSDIDIKAKICPNCGKKQGKRIGLIVVIIFVFFIIISIVSSGDDSASKKKSTSSNLTQEAKFSYDISNTYLGDYNMGYYIEGTITNNKDKDYSYVQIEFVCYDSEGNNIGTALDNTNNLLGKQTWKYKAMFMETDADKVDHCDFHEITGW